MTQEQRGHDGGCKLRMPLHASSMPTTQAGKRIALPAARRDAEQIEGVPTLSAATFDCRPLTNG